MTIIYDEMSIIDLDKGNAVTCHAAKHPAHLLLETSLLITPDHWLASTNATFGEVALITKESQKTTR